MHTCHKFITRRTRLCFPGGCDCNKFLPARISERKKESNETAVDSEAFAGGLINRIYRGQHGLSLSPMRFLPERTTTSVLLLAALIVILATLAVLQYQWSGQVSEAEHERMQRSLMASMGQFRQQFNLELLELGFLFEPAPAVVLNRDWRSYAGTCADLLDHSQDRLVANIYLRLADGGKSQLFRLNPGGRVFESAPWPAVLQSVRERYERTAPDARQPELRPFPAVMGSDIPLLVRPMPGFRPGRELVNGQFVGMVIIELSPEALRGTVFPELAQRYFAGPGGFAYRVAVIAQNPRRLIYVSDPGLQLETFDTPDARIGLWMGDPRAGGPPAAPEYPFFRRMPPDRRAEYSGPVPGPPDRGSGWQLVARHPRGSLEAAVATLRRRNLATSFGVLVLLAGSMALIIASARRAQRLARLQMDFVAGVSHELRTPLAVISSAGDNLADGVVEGSQDHVRQYGELIRTESRRLTGMVEQILQFGKLQRGPRKYDLRPAHLDEIAAEALNALDPALTAAGFSVETGFAPNLPPVNADAPVLSTCIQNLVQNAIKYSGKSRWLSVRTAPARTRGGTAVELVVEDRGIGIEPEDLPHIFDAFYRGRAAVAGQIHGAGLGLFMVREAVVSMGGSVRAESKVGSATKFTVTLPAAPKDGKSSPEAW
jgi:signal transduction histidine kinase